MCSYVCTITFKCMIDICVCACICTCTQMEAEDNLSFLNYCPLFYLRQVLSPTQDSPGRVDWAPQHKSTLLRPSSGFYVGCEAPIQIFGLHYKHSTN